MPDMQDIDRAEIASAKSNAQTKSQANPTVSVVIPTLNNEEYLPVMLHQIKEQNYTNFEAICVDRGSSDNTISIINDYVTSDPKFVFLECDGGSDSEARNLGVENARGKYIICFDPNGMIGADILEYMVAPLEKKSEVDVVICNVDDYVASDKAFEPADWIVDAAKIPINVSFTPYMIENFYHGICGYPFNKMIRKSLYTEYDLKWQNVPIHDDMSLTQSALSLANKVYFVNKRLYHRRVFSDDRAKTNTVRNTYYSTIFEALEEIKDNLQKYGKWKYFEKSFNNYALNQIKWKYYDVFDETKRSVHAELKNEWFDRLGLSNLGKDDFTSEDEYNWMKSVLESDEIIL